MINLRLKYGDQIFLTNDLLKKLYQYKNIITQNKLHFGQQESTQLTARNKYEGKKRSLRPRGPRKVSRQFAHLLEKQKLGSDLDINITINDST